MYLLINFLLCVYPLFLLHIFHHRCCRSVYMGPTFVTGVLVLDGFDDYTEVDGKYVGQTPKVIHTT